MSSGNLHYQDPLYYNTYLGVGKRFRADPPLQRRRVQGRLRVRPSSGHAWLCVRLESQDRGDLDYLKFWRWFLIGSVSADALV